MTACDVDPANSKPQVEGKPYYPVFSKQLDAQLTPDNSYVINFGNGVLQRVPRALDPTLDFANLKQPVDTFAIGMVFWYPEMVQTGWVPQMAMIFEKLQHKYVRQPDHFRVNITEMFYSTEEMGHIPWSPGEPTHGLYARPGQFFEFRTIEGNNLKGPREFHLRPSQFRGLYIPYFDSTPTQPVRSGIAKPVHAKVETQPAPRSTEIYLMSSTGPYELYMECPEDDGENCRANVYNKKTNIQFHMWFPAEAIGHTEEIIDKVYAMLSAWNK